MTPRREPAEDDWITAAQACALLGVKRTTLYSYASRGLVRRAEGARGERRYARDDVRRLAARAGARAGHGPVAAGALRWGEAVLDTAVSRVSPEGPAYRGVALVDVLAQRWPFERVAAHLWGVAHDVPWPSLDARGRRCLDAVPAGATALGAMLAAAAAWSARPDAGDDLDDVRAMVRALACAAGVAFGVRLREHPPEALAATALRALGCDVDVERVAAVDRALAVTADHELNPSTFAARVAASVGASLPACVTAALATMTGALHGGESDRLEALVAGDPAALRAAVADAGRRLPGFGHALYPAGDPRARMLWGHGPRDAALGAVVEASRDAPNLDAGLVVFRMEQGLPRGAGAALFALGRTAGWVAHAREQRTSGEVLRPRARYVGP